MAARSAIPGPAVLEGFEEKGRGQAGLADAGGAVIDKAELLAILRRSFEQAKTAYEQATAGDLDRQVWSNGTTARGVLLRLLAHVNEHLGQLIAYGRVNGVVPPWSR